LKPVDRVIKTLDHEEPDVVPLLQTFGQPEASDMFFPHDRPAISTEWVIREARWWGNDIIDVKINAPNLLEEVIVEEPGRTGFKIIREAWGSIIYNRRIPGFHKILQSPIRFPEDLDLIDPPPLDRYESKIKKGGGGCGNLQKRGILRRGRAQWAVRDAPAPAQGDEKLPDGPG
jgi:hypothetical protein